MEIIGNGFIAGHLRGLRDTHPHVTVLAAGVPRHPLPDSEHEREEILVRETIQRCRRRGQLLVFFSTVSMYGSPGCRGDEDEAVRPSTRYGRHKCLLENVIRESGVEHLLLRLGYLLGPGGPDFRLLPVMIRQIESGLVTVQPGARRDMLYVTEFVTLLDRLLAAGIVDETVNLASGNCVEITRIVDHLEYRLGITAERRFAAESLSHCPSVCKLRALIPESAAMGFGHDYYRTAIDRYLKATYHMTRGTRCQSRT